MGIEGQKALSVSGDAEWQNTCAEYFLQHGVDVHTAFRGRTAIDLMHKHTYDFIVVDDSVEDMSVLELSLYIPDLAPNEPVLLVACSDLARFKIVWERCNATVAGARPSVLEALGQYMSELNGNHTEGRPRNAEI